MKGADLLKFILSLIVVWIHTGTATGFLGWVVPVFFVLSGFFLSRRIIIDRDKATTAVCAWLGKTLRMYLIWTAIFIPYAAIGFWKDGLPILKSIAIWLRNILFVGENYLSWPLWYLLGLLQAGAIIWLVEKLQFPLWVYPLMAVILGVLPHIVSLDSIHAYTLVFKHTSNGIFIGFPCMVIGGILKFIFPQIQGWNKDSRYFRPAITLRFFSIHVYLTHMLWVGCLKLTTSIPRGVLLWALTCLAALITGCLLMPFPNTQKFLYGRSFFNPD